MITHIKKRDGRVVPFDISKVTDAIFKAAQALGGNDRGMAEELAQTAVKYVEKSGTLDCPTVEQIQDAVEKALIEEGHSRTSKEFILYRAERTRIREMNTRLMKTYEDLTFKDASENDIKRENANIDGDTAMGTMLKYGSEGAKQFYHMFMLKPEHSKAHLNGDIHIHDLDFYGLTTTCCQIDLDKLFTGGFSTGHGFLREPNDIQTYSALACIAIQSNQNDQHGGQSIPNFDYAMAKGVAKTYQKHYVANLGKALELMGVCEDGVAKAKEIASKIKNDFSFVPMLENDEEYIQKQNELLCEITDKDTVKKVENFAKKFAFEETNRSTLQAMQALIHNLNTMHSRAGAQIPFSSINYGMDTSPEGRMVMFNLLQATDDGLGNGETPIFPIQIFKVKEGINYNKEDKNYDLFRRSCEVSAKRLFPNYSFLDAPYNKKYYVDGHPETEVAYMGCRTRVVANEYDKTRETVYGRGNLSFTSINLPRLGIKSNGNIEFFFELLENEVNLVSDQLMERFKIQASKKVKNSPFLMGQGIWLDSDKLSWEDTVEEVLKHGTLTVGFIGLAECLTALIGKHHGESEDAQKLGLEIIGYMRKKMDDKCKETGMNYSLIATPAEGLSGRFVNIDKKKYGIVKGVTDKEYYTNSFHIPVSYPISAFEKIKLEAPYHNLTNGGHITYVELDGDPTKNIDAFEAIIRCMKESGIGYGSVNHPVDRDPICGFTGIIDNVCPRCGRTEGDEPFERIRRITGYLVGTLDRFNNAKKAEVADRVKHNVDMELI
ncbi:MAG: anaerobic ribonucleoside triphosphate reductase [Oscillospiraceae bacterium]